MKTAERIEHAHPFSRSASVGSAPTITMKLLYSHNAQMHTLDIERAGDDFEIEINGARARVQVISFAPPRITFLYNGKTVSARVVSDGKKRWVHVEGVAFVLERADAGTQRRHALGGREGTGSGIVTAPMPGQVRGVLVSKGDWVQEGQALLLLEAMKMEIRVTAPHAGQIVQLDTSVGQTVEREQVLARIQESDE